MEEPAIMLAADSDIDEEELEQVVNKIRRKMKRKIQNATCDVIPTVKHTCMDIDDSNSAGNFKCDTGSGTNEADYHGQSSSKHGSSEDFSPDLLPGTSKSKFIMEEPALMLTADSDIDEEDLERVVNKVCRKMKRKIWEETCDVIPTIKQPCVDKDNSNSAVNFKCDTGSEAECQGQSSKDGNSEDISPDLPGTSKLNDQQGTIGPAGDKTEKRKRKISSRLERIKKYKEQAVKVIFGVTLKSDTNVKLDLKDTELNGTNQASHVTNQASHVTNQASRVTNQASQVTNQASQVTNQASQVTNQASQVTNQASQVTNQASQVTNQASQVTNQASQVTNQASQVTNQAPQVTNQAPQVHVIMTGDSSAMTKDTKVDSDVTSGDPSDMMCPEQRDLPSIEKYVALDCEFVGVGFKGSINRLARCSMVDYDGRVLYDVYSCPEEPITDYRYRYSGIRREHMRYALPFEVVQKKVKDILKGQILVGHGVIQNDLVVLKIQHPPNMIRSTEKNELLLHLAKEKGCCKSGLKGLAKIMLDRIIQKKTHCSVEDARASMDLYKLVRTEWETLLLKKELDVQTNVPSRRNSEHGDNEPSYMDDQFWPKNEVTDGASNVINQPSINHLTSLSPNSDVKTLQGLHRLSEECPVSALKLVTWKLKLQAPCYHVEELRQCPHQYGCKVVVDFKEYWSFVRDSWENAKSSAAAAFFRQVSLGDLFCKPSRAAAILCTVCEEKKWEKPGYLLLSAEMRAYNRMEFVYQVVVNGQEYKGTPGATKKDAKRTAAEVCLRELKRVGYLNELLCANLPESRVNL